MIQKKASLIRRFAILIFSLITVLGLLFIIITYVGTVHYHQASTQLLNKDVAGHIAKFTSPFDSSGINKEKADSVFYNAMVLSPGAEVYFLDTTGKVIAFHADTKDILEWRIPLLPIEKYIDSKGTDYIKGTDPKDPDNTKIFSAAAVTTAKGNEGFIYVILDSKKSEGIISLLFGNHILSLAITAFLVVIFLSVIFSLIYLKRISNNFRQMIPVLESFENGDYSARFQWKKHDELEPVTLAFNRMADLLSSAINRLTKSEQERKNFIATISHDLRTPLSIARGYTETLMIKKDKGNLTPQEQEHYSQLIYNKMLQIENMVKQLFELSKMDDVNFKPLKEPFVFSEIVLEVVNAFQMKAAEKKIDLQCTQCINHIWVNADISMMERVVQNLVDNAVKNTPKNGSIQAWMEIHQQTVIFYVKNCGSTLPLDLQEWIKTAPENVLLSNQPARLGLGLRIVKKMLQLHQSSLTAQSAEGKNIFGFSIPIYQHNA